MIGYCGSTKQRYVPDSMKVQIKSLLRGRTEGLTPEELKSEFKKRFQSYINYSSLGFSDIKDFCINGLTDPCFYIGEQTIRLLELPGSPDLERPKPLSLPTDIIEKLLKVLSLHPEGIQDCDLNPTMRAQFGVDLDPTDYNYTSMKTLLGQNKDVFYVDQNWKVFDATQPRRGYKLQMFDPCRSVVTRLEVGEEYAVVWTVVRGPYEVWFNLKGDILQLCHLTAKMNQYYRGQYLELELEAGQLVFGALVAVKAVLNYCRGRVLRVRSGQVQVQLVDSGEVGWFDRVYRLRTRFLAAPFYGFRARLRGSETRGNHGPRYCKIFINKCYALNWTLSLGWKLLF